MKSKIRKTDRDYKKFSIKSPSGAVLKVTAETIYEACDYAVHLEGYKFTNAAYLTLNL